MKLAYRNYIRVRDTATAVGEVQPPIAKGWFTPQMVKEKTDMAINTVKKYLSQMEEDGVIEKIVGSKTLTVYRFSEVYNMGFLADRVQRAIGHGEVKNANAE